MIDHGHLDYGENKVQEAVEKWSDLKKVRSDINLHLIGRLQTNKVKFAVKLFDYIHSVDSQKLAKKIHDEQIKLNKKVKIFVQVNIGNEDQKSGIQKIELENLISYCKEIKLNVVGLMCIPPINVSPNIFFKEMGQMNINFGFKELSMGMSSDYIDAIKNHSTYVRVGSSIFGPRS